MITDEDYNNAAAALHDMTAIILNNKSSDINDNYKNSRDVSAKIFALYLRFSILPPGVTDPSRIALSTVASQILNKLIDEFPAKFDETFINDVAQYCESDNGLFDEILKATE